MVTIIKTEFIKLKRYFIIWIGVSLMLLTVLLTLFTTMADDGMTCVIVTHEMGFARHACDAVAFLCQGTLMEYGPSEELFTAPKTPELKRFLGKLLEWSV